MAFTFLTNVPLKQAKEEYIRLLRENGFSAKTETVAVEQSCGRITAKPVYAHISAPHYPASAMDGIALNARLSFGATETTPVTLNAGSSAGREDFSNSVIENIGNVLYHGIAIKPGKPAILGYRGEKPVLGFPGYPVSGILVLEKIVKPLIADWYRSFPESKVYQEAVLSRPVVSNLKYQEFIRVRMGKAGERIIASPLNHGSGVVSSFMKADGILKYRSSQRGIGPVRALMCVF